MNNNTIDNNSPTSSSVQVRSMIANLLGIDISQISIFSSFKSLGCDDLDLLEILMDTEKSFGVVISDYQVSSFVYVGDLVSYIDAYLSVK